VECIKHTQKIEELKQIIPDYKTLGEVGTPDFKTLRSELSSHHYRRVTISNHRAFLLRVIKKKDKIIIGSRDILTNYFFKIKLK